MKIDTGNLITFVLTAFSTLTVIIPFVVQSQAPDNQFFQINSERATGFILDNHSPLESKLWAYNQLHEYYNMNQTYSDIHRNYDSLSIVDNSFKNTTKIYNNIMDLLSKHKNIKFVPVSTLNSIIIDISNNIHNLEQNFRNVTQNSDSKGHLFGLPFFIRNITLGDNNIRKQFDKVVKVHFSNNGNGNYNYRLLDSTNSNITKSYGKIKSAYDGIQPIVNLQKDIFRKDNLQMAIMAYNTNSNKDYLNVSKSNPHPNPSSDSWYPLRIADLEASQKDGNNNRNPPEDRSCGVALCSFAQLHQISAAIIKLKENGNTSDYYNDVNKIHSLQKPLDTFLSDMNYFIIVSFVTGPIVFWAAVKIFNK